ncbi:histidine phosphotransferase family protein [Parvibaculum sp.]|uniref:histidine phosphotransferase ChpT n=1 Tax=Parvibaculum sp. TaxID=2024848 RepID=UPI000C959460|nr:histidine phosphotransferase family protein [Parvibaculum sp.]MAB15035.1 histidine phosphotransferase [Parvibaculum sp.]
MTEMTEVPALELAALMCSRVCHDVISPVGAIVNGLEVLAEDDDEEMRAHAIKLITDSAAQASAKLQFARLAFGAAGSAGAEIDLADARAVIEAMTAGDRVKIVWEAPAANMGKDYVKLLLNMVLIGMAAVPRGGEVVVKIEGEISAPTILVRSIGQAARIPDETSRFLHGPDTEAFLDARAAQPYFTGAVARSLGLDIEAGMEGEDFAIVAKPKG